MHTKLYVHNIDTGIMRGKVLNKFGKYPDCKLFPVYTASFVEMGYISGKYYFWKSIRNADKFLDHAVLLFAKLKDAEAFYIA